MTGGLGGPARPTQRFLPAGPAAFHRGKFSVYVTNWQRAISPRFGDQSRKSDTHRARCRSSGAGKERRPVKTVVPNHMAGVGPPCPALPRKPDNSQGWTDSAGANALDAAIGRRTNSGTHHQIKKKARAKKRGNNAKKDFSADLKAIALCVIFLLPPTNCMANASF